MSELVFPSDPLLRATYGSGLNADPIKAARAYRTRLVRAESRGVLPRRVYISPRIYGWDRAELEDALAKLPRSYAGFKQVA